MPEHDFNTDISPNGTPLQTGGKLLSYLRKIFWVGIVMLDILLVLSIVALSAMIVDYALADDRTVVLESNMNASMDVFAVSYVNGTGEITVQGAKGENVVAPGTELEHIIRFRNADKRAIDYEITPTVTFTTVYRIPLMVRIIDPQGNYILGDAEHWVPIEQLDGFAYRGTLKRGQETEYVFQWKWPYESGDDAYDTLLGQTENAGLKISFNLLAATNTLIDTDANILESPLAKVAALAGASTLLLTTVAYMVVSIVKRKATDPSLPPSQSDF